MSDRRERRRAGSSGKRNSEQPSQSEREGLTTAEQNWLLEQMAMKRSHDAGGGTGQDPGSPPPGPGSPGASSVGVPSTEGTPEAAAAVSPGREQSPMPHPLRLGPKVDHTTASGPSSHALDDSFWNFG